MVPVVAEGRCPVDPDWNLYVDPAAKSVFRNVAISISSVTWLSIIYHFNSTAIKVLVNTTNRKNT
jgi:hypothetical protein